MVTGAIEPAVLETCHIVAVADDGADRLENLLLLRRDLHALFDANLLSFRIDGETCTVCIDPSVKGKHPACQVLDGIVVQWYQIKFKRAYLEARKQ